jgi:manganese/zinc/iron transport system permease protein
VKGCNHILAGAVFMLCTGTLSAQTLDGRHIDWPTAAELLEVLTLTNYNTRVVILGTSMLGLTGGLIGTFMLLRKRSLMGDAIAHATLPGIGLAFIIMTTNGGTGKWLPGLLLGATISGVLGMLLILGIRHNSRLKEDTALGIVLSVFFGLGVVILAFAQRMKHGSSAGLESFIYGKTASMLASDAQLIGCVGLLVALAVCLLYKEFSLLCFDQNFASAQGFPVVSLDIALMVLVVAVTVIGLQAVGLILIIAMLIIPAAAARFWTEHLGRMMITAAVIGGFSGFFGAAMSALVPRLPAGAVIVVVAGVAFGISMIFGSSRGVLLRYLKHGELARKVSRQNLLRAMFERLEATERNSSDSPGMSRDDLLAVRSWSSGQLNRLVRRMKTRNLLYEDRNERVRLTESGLAEARRIVHNHRLWELYLITHADVAPSRVDRDADQIEHVLGQSMVETLEKLLKSEYPDLYIPDSPHPMET